MFVTDIMLSSVPRAVMTFYSFLAGYFSHRCDHKHYILLPQKFFTIMNWYEHADTNISSRLRISYTIPESIYYSHRGTKMNGYKVMLCNFYQGE